MIRKPYITSLSSFVLLGLLFCWAPLAALEPNPDLPHVPAPSHKVLSPSKETTSQTPSAKPTAEENAQKTPSKLAYHLERKVLYLYCGSLSLVIIPIGESIPKENVGLFNVLKPNVIYPSLLICLCLCSLMIWVIYYLTLWSLQKLERKAPHYPLLKANLLFTTWMLFGCLLCDALAVAFLGSFTYKCGGCGKDHSVFLPAILIFAIFSLVMWCCEGCAFAAGYFPQKKIKPKKKPTMHFKRDVLSVIPFLIVLYAFMGYRGYNQAKSTPKKNP